jgi:hypothetical protein
MSATRDLLAERLQDALIRPDERIAVQLPGTRRRKARSASLQEMQVAPGCGAGRCAAATIIVPLHRLN